MRASKWFRKLKEELVRRGFTPLPSFSIMTRFGKDGLYVSLRPDGYFAITFPDGHWGDCAAGSTKDPIAALVKALDDYAAQKR